MGIFPDPMASYAQTGESRLNELAEETMDISRNKLVYIIILNWNGSRDTIACVESCLNLEYPLFKIVVVDNGSDDDSETILKKRFPTITLIQTGANLGYAGGNNAGLRHAHLEQADYVWFLNNDTVVDPMSLAELVRISETEPAIGMTGSKILSFSEPSTLLYAGGRVDLATGTCVHIGMGEKDTGQYDTLTETGYITGCSLLVKRTVAAEIGPMDESFFLYYEETDWCLRAKNKGYRLMYVPTSVVFHKDSASTGKIKGSMLYYITRNGLYFLQRHGTDISWFGRFRTDMTNMLRFLYHKEFALAGCMVKAYMHWLRGLMGPADNPVRYKNAGSSQPENLM